MIDDNASGGVTEGSDDVEYRNMQPPDLICCDCEFGSFTYTTQYCLMLDIEAWPVNNVCGWS